MRILHVCDSYLPQVGGIELHVDDLADRQRQTGDSVRVATLTAGEDTTQVVRLPRTGLFPDSTARAALGRLVAEADLVHAHASLVSPLVWAALEQARQHEVASVVTMHSMLPTGGWASLLRPVLPRVPSSTVLTAVSTVAASALGRLVGREVAVLPNGIDPDRWRARSDRSRRGPLTLVSTMRTTRRKRPLPLLDILDDIRQAVPAQIPLQAYLIGAGPLDGAIRRRLARSDLGRWVQQTGQLPRAEIVRIMGAADLYLAPATLESFGIAALEARCAGLPVVGMARSGLVDFIEDGVGGFLAATDQEMAALSAQLLLDRGRLEAMRLHNVQHPPSTDWATVLDLHRQVYRRAVRTVARRPAMVLS